MTFYGPTFPNETHYEKLQSGRQRFGNRSANMFFVRPARHIACPRRLKYIHDIKTGYIPYVEDSVYDQRPSQRFCLPKSSDEEKNKSNGLGLYNATDVWRQELMDLAQQVKTSLVSPDDQELYSHQGRSSRLQKHRQKRSTSSVLSNYSEENDDLSHPKRLLHRRVSSQYQRSQVPKSKTSVEKPEPESTNNDENQDPGIWLIPLLCYVLQIDNVVEAQDWLVNANPTEKRLAMELISRTMQDMQTHENEISSDVSATDSSTVGSNLNNVYWPYKMWQRQEKQRQHSLKQPKSNAHSVLPSLTVDNGETCERATSPFRMLTPAKRSSGVQQPFTTADTMTLERSVTRLTNDRTTPTYIYRQSPSPVADRSHVEQKPAVSTLNTSTQSTTTERRSRRGYRVTTSMNYSFNVPTNRSSPVSRGKTPLI